MISLLPIMHPPNLEMLPKFQNMHPYRITPGTDIPEHVGTTYPALPGPPAVPETYLLIRHSGGAQEWGSDDVPQYIYTISYTIFNTISYTILIPLISD